MGGSGEATFKLDVSQPGGHGGALAVSESLLILASPHVDLTEDCVNTMGHHPRDSCACGGSCSCPSLVGQGAAWPREATPAAAAPHLMLNSSDGSRLSLCPELCPMWMPYIFGCLTSCGGALGGSPELSVRDYVRQLCEGRVPSPISFSSSASASLLGRCLPQHARLVLPENSA